MIPSTRNAAIVISVVVLLCVSSPLASAQFFETRGKYHAATSPRTATVGDFNNDGKLDLAVTLFLSNQVGIMLGNGDGSFGPPTYYTISPGEESVYSVATADFNHDGKLDLAVADYLNHRLVILLGNGDGTFVEEGPVATSGSPQFVTVADMNGDGNPDLVISDFPHVSILLGKGDGTFRAPFDSSASRPNSSLAVADFNGDGKLDVAVLNQTTGFSLLNGNGDGTLQPAVDHVLTFGNNQIVAADLNHDGKVDLAIAGTGLSMSTLLGNGDGTFQKEVDYSAPYSENHLAVVDLNGDGIPDLVDVGWTSVIAGRLISFLGNGDGSFVQQSSIYAAGREPFFMVAADFNGDGLPDVVVPNYGGDSVISMTNTGVVSFSPSTPLQFPPQKVGTISQVQAVTLTNTGMATLNINSVDVSGAFVLQSTCGSSVAPGGSCSLAVRFKPVKVGPASGRVSISSGASSKPQLIQLLGQGQ